MNALLHSQSIEAATQANMIHSQVKALAELSLHEGFSPSDWYFLLQSVVDRMQWLVTMLEYEELETCCELHSKK